MDDPLTITGSIRDSGSIPGFGTFPGGGHSNWSAFLSGESQGQRSLASYGPQGRKESDMIEEI